MNGYGNSIGSQRTVTCDPGFNLEGNGNILCLQGGVWSQPGRCIESIRCSTLPEVPNGRIGSIGENYVNSNRSVACNQGFRINGPNLIHCLSSGQWTNPGICITASNGDLRLTNRYGNDVSLGGILEIYQNGQWGAICHEGFEYLSARVACRHLGYNPETATFDATALPPSNPVSLARVKCRGGESGIHYCDRDMYGQYECPGSKIVSLDCARTSYFNSNAKNRIRLTGSNVNGIGFVEIYNRNRWEAVCSDGLSPASASVACKQLGFNYSNAIQLPGSSFSFLTSTGSSVSNVRNGFECRGNEMALNECPPKTCNSTYDVAITCIGSSIARASNTEKFQIAIAMNDHEEVDRLLALRVSVNTNLGRCCDERLNTSGLTNPPALKCAGCFGSYGVLRSLIRNGANVNPRYNSWTALMDAARYGNSEMVKYLVDNGADVNARNNDQWTPLMIAARYGPFEMVKYLVDNGSDVNARYNEQWTPLMIAAWYGTFEMVKYLVDNGADVNAKNQNQWTPLLYTTRYGTFEMVQYLVDNGADVNAKNQNQWTPLMLAARYGTFEMVKYLVDNGADVNATEDDGWDVLRMARNYGTSEMVQYLINHGAN